MRKKILVLTLAFLLLSQTMTFAQKAERPMKSYRKYGTTFCMKVKRLDSADNELYQEFRNIAVQFNCDPIIFIYDMAAIGNIVKGFSVEYSDGSKAIYISCTLEPNEMRMIFMHELVHYMYSTPKSLKSDPDLYEKVTDLMASELYEAIYSDKYVYTYDISKLENVDELKSIYMGLEDATK